MRYKRPEGAAPLQCRSHCLDTTSLTMGRKVILAVVSWLTLSQAAFGDNNPAKQSAVVKDNESAASAPRLYRNVPVGVYSYASAAPYASYSFHLPQFVAAPKTAASQVAPVKQKPGTQNINTYLMDSYGNKFAEGPQLASYKAAFPQQYLTLQPKLPEHLAQPLVAASPNFQFKQSGPQVFFGAPFRVPALQSPAPTPLNFPSFGQHLVYADKVQSLSPNSNIRAFGAPSAQQQSTNNKAVFSNYKTEQKFQRLQEIPFGPPAEAKFQRLQGPPQSNNNNGQIQAAPAHTAVTYVDDSGKKTVVNVETEPVPLLDLTLLEPLTFDNPLVPQVQHFLPRINQATYKKLPIDTGAKPLKEVSKKKQKKPTYKQSKKNAAPRKTVPQHETLDEAPEISYVISKAPGHVETYNEKSITYNKETQSDPVHHSYGSKTESEPVTYSYSRSSKEPTTHYSNHNNGQGPSQLIYHFNPEEQTKALHAHTPHSSSENLKDSSQESEEDDSGYHRNHHNENYKKQPKSSEEHHEPESKEQEQYHRPEKQRESSHPNPPKYYADPGHQTAREIEPVTHEEDIQLIAKAHIKVDPTQHVQTSQEHGPSQHTPHSSREHEDRPHEQSNEHSHELSEEQSDEPRQHEHSSPQQHTHSSPGPHHHHHYSHANAPNAHVHEKSKRIIIHEEAPDGMHMLSENMKEEVINHEENNENEFEKAYKNAAIGFPAYSKQALEASEKEIFNPESYGVPHDHLEYNIEHTPFQQYQEEGNAYPKESRTQYKHTRDKMKDDYYADYSISKPGSFIDRYQNKLGYYKLYKQQKPEYLESDDDDDDNKKNQKPKFAKYTAPPTFDFPAPKKQKSESYVSYGQQKPKQQLYQYEYIKPPRADSSAFASQPYQRYRKTNFVEPQFQYGFEPIPIPKLLIDSELAAMASNHSPESKDPGMRKKVYKENWYIKKTSTSAGAPAS